MAAHKSTSQSQTCTPKKGMVTVWWSAACLIHYSFLNPSKTIVSEKYAQQTDDTYWKPQCLQLALVNRKDPIFLHNIHPHVAQSTLQKLNELGYKVMPHLPYSPDLLTTNYHFFKHLDNFLQGKCFYNHQDAENAFQEFFKSLSTDFYATGINLFLIGKNVSIVIITTLLNNDVFEPSYNNLKFMVWNCN